MTEKNDLLVSFLIDKMRSRHNKKHSPQTSQSVTVRRRQRGHSTLQVGSDEKLQRYLKKRNWPKTAPRTILSWLLHSEVVSLNEVIQFRSPKDDKILKEATITKDGLTCLCCSKTLSIPEFEAHAGLECKQPCTNLVMESGQPLVSCQLEAWSLEYKTKRVDIKSSQVDEGDDLCGICGAGGELVCCDNCPAAYHQGCLSEQLPEGKWYCLQCRCLTCRDAVNNKVHSLSPGTLKCSLCKHRYHETCVKGLKANIPWTSDNWFCGQSCHGIYKGLQSRIGLMNHLSDGISWSLLRCITGDLNARFSPSFIALKATCNSKLAVAITLLEEHFVNMVDVITNIDMIPQVIYNWGSQFNRLNFEGFYTVILEKRGVLVSVASIRIHGKQVAELPFVATCSKFKKQGMCRILICNIEEMLKSLKVEKVVLPAGSPELVSVWINKFGFQHLNEDDKRSLRTVNLMLLPGSTWLIKPLSQNPTMNQEIGETNLKIRDCCWGQLP